MKLQDKLGIVVWGFTTISIIGMIFSQYFYSLYEVYLGHSPNLNVNFPLNIYFMLLWNLSSLKYFLKYFINLPVIEIRNDLYHFIKVLFMILGIIFFLIYSSTYNKLVNYPEVPILEILYFNFPWVYFFISWLIICKVESEIIDSI